MFWKKKQMVVTPAEAGTPVAATSGVTPPVTKAKAEKLPGPKGIPELVGRHLVVALKQDPDWAWKLKSVVRPMSDVKSAFEFRVFDSAQVAAKKIAVTDYTSLDEHPDLILYQGWFNKKSGQVQMKEKKAV
jgi:hypothetical protein